MASALFYQPEISHGVLSPDESRHALTVLRLKEGDEIEITDGKGCLYTARLGACKKNQASFEIISSSTKSRRQMSIHLAVAPTKNIDRMEWLVEKCVETGVESIHFMKCARSERKDINIERLQKVAVSALKQSSQVWMPALHPMVPFEEILCIPVQDRFIAMVDESNPVSLQLSLRKNVDTLVLVGPEGDFSEEEAAAAQGKGFRKVSLGPNRLRTETAGLVAVVTMNLASSL